MRPKIAIVIPGFQSSPDDWCIPVFTNLAREMAKRVELHVFALRYPPRRDTYSVGEVVVHSLGAGQRGQVRLPGLSLITLWNDFLAQVEREHKLSPFSAVLGIWATESGWLATRASRRLQVKSLVHVAGGELVYLPEIRYGNNRRGLSGLLVERTLKQADLLTVPSLPMRRALSDMVSPGKVRYWAPGVDTNLFAPSPRDSQKKRTFEFVTVGSLVPVKGHDLLLRALALLRAGNPNREFRLNIVGDGPLRQRLEGLARGLDLTGYVAFLSEVPHDMLPAVYSRSHAFLLGSWHESQCMAALEAMSCGLPCVAPDVGALADIATIGGRPPAVLLYSERTAESVAAAMAALAHTSPDELCACGRSARETVLENYELTIQTARLLAIIEKLTSS